MTIDLTSILLTSILVANTIFAIVVVFFERKRPAEMLAWLLVFVFLPVIGFFLYMFFGQKIFNRRKSFALKQEDDEKLVTAVMKQYEKIDGLKTKDTPLAKDLGLIRMGLEASAPLTTGNDITIFAHGTDKFAQLFEDIHAAKESIHLEYFIWRDNDLGRQLIDALTSKAQAGVSVKVILDDWGCKLTPKRRFSPLINAGGDVHWFLPVSLAWSFNANYRNHRKIAVIDGVIGYTGGMNVGDEYMGLRPDASPWRDTHIRITGPAAAHLETRFLMDYAFASGKEVPLDSLPPSTNLLDQGAINGSAVQIICSGPDSKEQHVKQGLFKMINQAEESLYLQTPYLVPDESILEALKVAAFSGVDVRVMIPGIFLNRFVHRVTMAYAGELLQAGVRIFEYHGFLHSKTLVMDKRVLTIGTTNLDIRSFALNFEVNAFVYDGVKATEYANIFLRDLESSAELTLERYSQRGLWSRFAESVCRLFAPLM